jgi:hypothetical protein
MLDVPMLPQLGRESSTRISLLKSVGAADARTTASKTFELDPVIIESLVRMTRGDVKPIIKTILKFE